MASAQGYKRILVAEDDDTNRSMLRRYLEKKGYAVVEATNGIEVLDALQRASVDERFDLVLLDWMMPVLSGVDALRRLRAEGQHMPVIVLTARGDPKDTIEALELGADDYVTKPYELGVLAARIEARLRREEPRARPQPTAATGPMLGIVVDGRYELLEQIGSGSFGVVYRARHTTLETDVAVKILRSVTQTGTAVLPSMDGREDDDSNARGPDDAERFRREGVRTCRVQHDNAVRVFDFGVLPNGLPFLVMECLRGRTLDKELQACGPLDVRRAVELLIPVCACLAAAHEQNIIHRDIKPANIFLHQADGRDVVKVLDFGVATLVDGGHESSLDAFMGSPAYIAPERLRGRRYDGRSDVYSVGITLYQLLTGTVPFKGENNDAVAVALMQVSDEAVPPTHIRPSLHPAVDATVARFLTKDPKARPTAHEAIERLHDLLDAAML